MKKTILYLVSFLSLLFAEISFAQTTEVFEDETAGTTSFTHIEQTFNFTSTASGETYDIETFANGGWNGTATDNKFLDNTGISNQGDGTNFTIKHSNTNVNFTVKELYLFCSNKFLEAHSGTLTITGKIDGNVIPVFTITKNSGFAAVKPTFSPNNGYTHINFATEEGVDNSNKVIDELIFSSTGNLDYLGLDAFKFDLISKVWDGSAGTNWTTAASWSEDIIPTATDDVIIPNIATKPVISSSTGAVANNITIDASSSVTVESGGSLIIDGTPTVNGSFIYNVNVADDKWHLISSPVVNEQFDDTWNDTNGINTSGTGNNEAVSWYINTSDADGDWVYYQNNAGATTFGTGIGYSLKRTGAGNYSFIGTFPSPPVDPTITASNIGTPATENRWTLVGNPFPSYINIATFLGANGTPLTDTHENVWVWNANANGGAGEYQDLTTGFIHPGQAFFVSSNVASTSVTFTKAMQSHQTGVTFYRTSNPKITLMMDDGSINKSTEINYFADKTTGLDPRFDIGTFTGQSSSLNIYTHLVSNSDGVDFKRQALPDNNYENMVIPIGVNAQNGKEIDFSLNTNNFPTDLKVFLEDKLTNTFTRLDGVNSSYKVTLSENLNGIGRFYLHTTESALSIDTNFILDNISIYKLDNTTLRITGLSKNNASIKLFTLLGKQVMKSSFNSNRVKDISLPKLATGVYIVQLETESGKLNKKIILE